MNKVIITFCEGDHDIAVLSKLLSIYGYSPYRKKVKDFPNPFNQLYINILSENIIEDSEFKFQRPNKYIPFVALSKDDVLVIFHNLGGDGNILNGGTKSIIDKYIELNDEALRKVNKYDEINFRFLYFLDADDIGVEDRLSEVKDLLELDSIEHHQIHPKDSFEVGCYVFHDRNNSSKNGTLENLLLDLMKLNNEQVFDHSLKFINDNKLNSDRQKKYICDYEVDDKYEGSIQFKNDKSIISIAGQLQFSGSNNSVIIANSDYIQTDDIKGNNCCNDILNLF
jgi:hypothetical protein